MNYREVQDRRDNPSGQENPGARGDDSRMIQRAKYDRCFFKFGLIYNLVVTASPANLVGMILVS
jgi:hypothetical protein